MRGVLAMKFWWGRSILTIHFFLSGTISFIHLHERVESFYFVLYKEFFFTVERNADNMFNYFHCNSNHNIDFEWKCFPLLVRIENLFGSHSSVWACDTFGLPPLRFFLEIFPLFRRCMLCIFWIDLKRKLIIPIFNFSLIWPIWLKKSLKWFGNLKSW